MKRTAAFVAGLLLAPAISYGLLDRFGAISTSSITNGSVTFAKLQDIPTQTVIGRNTAGTGSPESVTATQELDWIASTTGTLLYRGTSAWLGLTSGLPGQVLTIP